MRKKLLICDCGKSDHQIIVSAYIENNNDPWVLCEIHLSSQRNIFKRILYAIKYIFGYKNSTGCFEEFVLSKKHVNDLKAIIKYLNK